MVKAATAKASAHSAKTNPVAAVSLFTLMPHFEIVSFAMFFKPNFSPANFPSPLFNGAKTWALFVNQMFGNILAHLLRGYPELSEALTYIIISHGYFLLLPLPLRLPFFSGGVMPC